MSRQDDPSPFCSAGLYNFHINSNLQLGLCHLLNQPRFNLTGKTFKEGFTGLLSAERDRLYYRPADCLDCPADVFCGQCPARADIECNDPQAKVQYLCDLAKKRYEVFKPILEPTV